MRTMVRLTVALAVAATEGCDGGGSIPYADFVPSVTAAACHQLVLCGNYPDQATCLASDQQKPHFYDTLGQDIAAGKVSYNGAKASICIQLMNAGSSCSNLSALNIDAQCGTIFTGNVSVGGTCFFTEECVQDAACEKTDLTCDSFSQCCAGSCLSVPPPSAVGGDCTARAATCVSGTVCDIDSTGLTATCRMTVGPGAACSASAPCAYPLYCDPMSQTCKAPVVTGGACNPILDSEDCDNASDRCNAQTSVCTPLLPLGSACDPSTNGCMAYATCDLTTSTCIERPGVGAACDSKGGGPSCLGGSCDATTGTCMLLTPVGGACS